MVVIGVDPGGRSTGIVARRGEELLGYKLVQRVPHQSIAELISVVIDGLAITLDPEEHDSTLLAVEDLSEPVPQMGVVSLRGLLDAAQVLGAVIAEAVTLDLPLVVVPPGAHGSSRREAYPVELWGPHERAGTGMLRHCRSAWDISLAGERLWRFTTGQAGDRMVAAIWR